MKEQSGGKVERDKKEKLDPNDKKVIQNRSLFDPSYLAEIYQEFYRELAKAYTGMVNGFKKYK